MDKRNMSCIKANGYCQISQLSTSTLLLLAQCCWRFLNYKEQYFCFYFSFCNSLVLFFLKKEKLLLEKQLAWEQSKTSQTLHIEHTACVKVTSDKVATHSKAWRKEKVAWSLSHYLQLWRGKVLYCHILTNLWPLERKCKKQDLHLYFVFRFHLWWVFSIFETTDFDSHIGLISNVIAFAKLMKCERLEFNVWWFSTALLC